MLTHVRGGYVVHKCQNKNTRERMWRTSCTGIVRGGFWEIWKSQWVESWLGGRRLTFACSPKPGQWPCGRYHTCWVGVRWKSQNRKNVYLSPYVEEPLNSKVIKSFVPELRSHKCFSCFRIPMFYVCMLWTLYVRFTYLYHGYGTYGLEYGLRICRFRSIWTCLITKVLGLVSLFNSISIFMGYLMPKLSL